RNNNIAFHTDACQSFGKIPVDPEKIHADMISLNAHKIYGPKGVGALYIRKGTVIEPILHGGGQERGLRSTTENIPGIAGFAKAAELCHEQMDNEIRRLQSLRNHFIDRLHNDSEEVYFNGPEDGYPGIINFSFRGREGESIHLLLMLDEAGVAVSTGSACSSNHSNASGSHVLNAMGRNPVEARGAIRVSIGRFNTVDDMDNFCDILHNVYSKLKTVYSH
ncbi:MAG: aminotransferase class V-fold PLP-dependent enzyme, partial [Bacteroidota bacterium]|nr:aminotransferase class V-fold PLP-dependent enzyme [Bacteroidota bacterium]